VKGYFPNDVPNTKLGLITLNKVLEHIHNPSFLLKQIRSQLAKSSGILYIEIPCISNIWLKPSTDNAMQSVHFNLYSIPSLTQLLASAGFLTLKAERIAEPSGKISIYAFATPDVISEAT
jgi:hypothetical protein